MITEKFRRQLRQEAKLWQTEGLIDNPTHDSPTEAQSQPMKITMIEGRIHSDNRNGL